jgi:hypothetical protein
MALAKTHMAQENAAILGEHKGYANRDEGMANPMMGW